MLLGAIEAGGTKMVCAIGNETGHIYEQISIATTTPEETVPKMLAYFAKMEDQYGHIAALGIAAFGPVDVKKESPTYGRILDTPKLAWQQYDIVRALRWQEDLAIGLDTDVNAACLGEMTYGSAKGLDDVLYLTIGTGIGAGIASGGKLVHGMLHPEAGHILMHPQKGDEGHGICPYHEGCFEGLASGPSIEKRWGRPAKELLDCEEVWELEAEYIAEALVQYICVVSPRRLILGGGVMHVDKLFPLIRQKVAYKLQGYLKTKELANLDTYIVPASLQDNQGIMGCLKLAIDALGAAK